MNQSDKKQKTVFVGLSGGVDSSVAALRLLKAGYQVVGVFIKVWQPDFLECDWETERLDAMRVAAKLKIPFLTCDAEQDYKKEVGEYFVNEYLAGRTPNPDVMCNQHVKFGAFLRFATERGADFIATGHYARVVEKNGKFTLLKGKDINKDQTYFLWTLGQAELSKTLFPVGDSDKEEIRKEAEEAGLPTAAKKDSQGICFLGHVDIPEFLSHFTKLEDGVVLDEAGHQIGEHQGALVYTLGQRHGFTIKSQHPEQKRLYVVKRDLDQNTITVAEQPPLTELKTTLSLTAVNWIQNEPTSNQLEASFRYRQTPVPVTVTKVNDTWQVEPHSIIDKPVSGQSCVLYSGDECVGGGIIKT